MLINILVILTFFNHKETAIYTYHVCERASTITHTHLHKNVFNDLFIFLQRLTSHNSDE